MSTPRNLRKVSKRSERANYRAYKKARWARKTLAEKFATVWLYALVRGFVAVISGFLLVMTAIGYWEMPWYADTWFTIAFVVVGITWWALSQG